MKYPCDKCEYAATTPYGLRSHIENIHEGIKKHPCNKCEYATTTAHKLKKHISNKH